MEIIICLIACFTLLTGYLCNLYYEYWNYYKDELIKEEEFCITIGGNKKQYYKRFYKRTYRNGTIKYFEIKYF